LGGKKQQKEKGGVGKTGGGRGTKEKDKRKKGGEADLKGQG
jgi:hypothetical protein